MFAKPYSKLSPGLGPTVGMEMDGIRYMIPAAWNDRLVVRRASSWSHRSLLVKIKNDQRIYVFAISSWESLLCLSTSRLPASTFTSASFILLESSVPVQLSLLSTHLGRVLQIRPYSYFKSTPLAFNPLLKFETIVLW
jgi:hypothetical protein